MSIFDTFFGPPVPQVMPSEAHQKLNSNSKPFLLDVREPEEYRQAHIQGATLISLGSLQSNLNRLPKNREILVVCASGSRSVSATRSLVAAGYQAVNVRGGLGGWMRSGLPIKRGN